MANFKDYAGQADRDIASEVSDAQSATETRRNIPDSVRRRFDGKSIEDAMEQYAALEVEKSRLGRQVGQMRTNQDRLVEQTLNQPQRQDTTESVKPLTVDEFYENPDAAINRVVSSKTDARVQALEDELATERQRRALQDLDTRFNGWQDEVQSPDFKDWVAESAYRQRVAGDADRYDLDAANDLLELWYEQKAASTQQTEHTEVQTRQLEAATMEQSGPTALGAEETFSRHELQKRRVAATQGSWEAKEWLDAHQDAIVIAYEEGRITD